jgi:ankyrin repeat protein
MFGVRTKKKSWRASLGTKTLIRVRLLFFCILARVFVHLLYLLVFLEYSDIDQEFNLWSSSTAPSSSALHEKNDESEAKSLSEGSAMVPPPHNDSDAAGPTTEPQPQPQPQPQAHDSFQSRYALCGKPYERDEVYSTKYWPTRTELDEVQRIEAVLVQNGTLHNAVAESSKWWVGHGRRRPSAVQAHNGNLWNAMVRPSNQEQAATAPSIILFHGPCRGYRTVDSDSALGHGRKSGSGALSSDTEPSQACELVAVTTGLVVAPKANSSHSTMTTLLWSNVESVARTRATIVVTYRRLIDYRDMAHCDTGEPVATPTTPPCSPRRRRAKPTVAETLPPSEFCNATTATLFFETSWQAVAWWNALRTIVIQYHEYHLTCTDLGWQYRYVYTPYFTMAVTNLIDDSHCPITHVMTNNRPAGSTHAPSESPVDLSLPQAQPNDTHEDYSPDINAIDEYNGLAALQYAVKLNHAPAVSTLLEMGANPNVTDANGHSPIYWAALDQASPTILSLLKEYGVKDSPQEHLDNLMRGELFGRVAATETKMRLEKEALELQQNERAQAAAATMSRNLRLLQHRGEQIDELGDKATDLRQGAEDFASLARQLKEASKKQSQWLPF